MENEKETDLETRNKKVFEYLPLVLTFIGIVICSIVFKQTFIKTLPVCFSLIINLLSARANRIAFLFGATNCIIYIVGYYMEGVYGTMISTVFSACLQFASFFVWKKRAYKQATEFRVLKNKSRIVLGVLLVCSWVIVSYVLACVNSKEYVVDGLNLVIGFVLPFMQMFALIDSVPLHLLSIVLSLIMWIRIIFINGAWANTTYLISTLFSLYMAIRMAIKWIALYKEQKSLKDKREVSN